MALPDLVPTQHMFSVSAGVSEACACSRMLIVSVGRGGALILALHILKHGLTRRSATVSESNTHSTHIAIVLIVYTMIQLCCVLCAGVS